MKILLKKGANVDVQCPKDWNQVDFKSEVGNAKNNFNLWQKNKVRLDGIVNTHAELKESD